MPELPDSPPDHVSASDRPEAVTAALRGLRGLCPACGEGRLFARYLKPVDRCASCGTPLGHVRSDDAAPWLTILVVGHIVVPLLLMVEQSTDWPIWVPMTLWPAVAMAMMLWMLPRAKGLLLGVIWATGAPGSEEDPAPEPVP